MPNEKHQTSTVCTFWGIWSAILVGTTQIFAEYKWSYHYTAQETVTFLNVSGNFVFFVVLLTICIINLHVKQLKMLPFQFFSYFVSWRVNSKISLQNIRKIIVNGYSVCFGFFKIVATYLTQSMTRNSDKIHHVNANASSNDLASLSFFRLSKSCGLRQYDTSNM